MKHNYLNNKDILKEIHKSKNTYCWYAVPEDADYDIIVSLNNKGIIAKKDVLRAVSHLFDAKKTKGKQYRGEINGFL